ncbi:hypothetical protein H0W26_04495 [Candidatus Dependentiae bacterium]|nr:hypothetical protein [Candidatus Dependentiae bacterium]
MNVTLKTVLSILLYSTLTVPLFLKCSDSDTFLEADISRRIWPEDIHKIIVSPNGEKICSIGSRGSVWLSTIPLEHNMVNIPVKLCRAGHGIVDAKFSADSCLLTLKAEKGALLVCYIETLKKVYVSESIDQSLLSIS